MIAACEHADAEPMIAFGMQIRLIRDEDRSV
jgi:hypothetical protein